MTSVRSRASAVKYQALLVLAAAVWGLGTVVIKDTVGEFSPSWLVGIRFFSAGVIACVVFARRFVRLARAGALFDHVRAGVILGLLVAAAYLCNTGGLTDTTAAKSSFLTGVYCVLVPFIAWGVMRRRPTTFNLVAAFLCLAGVGLVSLPAESSFSLGWGDAVTLVSAVFLGFQVVATSKLAPGRDMAVLTSLQFLLGGALALAFAAATEPPPEAAVLLDPATLGNLAYLVVFATCLALLLQNVGLARVSPSSGALLLSLESVFGVVFSVLLLGEQLSAAMVLGFALIFCAVLVSERLPGVVAGSQSSQTQALP